MHDRTRRHVGGDADISGSGRPFQVPQQPVLGIRNEPVVAGDDELAPSKHRSHLVRGAGVSVGVFISHPTAPICPRRSSLSLAYLPVRLCPAGPLPGRPIAAGRHSISQSIRPSANHHPLPRRPIFIRIQADSDSAAGRLTVTAAPVQRGGGVTGCYT